jgi:sporulation related protein
LQEFELSVMRNRFLAVSEQIANELAVLSNRIGEAPPALRGPLLVAAGQIAKAQERLRAEADRLAGLPTQRAAIMQKVLQVQDGAFRQLTAILKQHVPFAPNHVANVARQLAAGSYAYPPTWPTPGKMGNRGAPAPYPASGTDVPEADEDAMDAYSWLSDASDSLAPTPEEPEEAADRGETLWHRLAAGRISAVARAATTHSLTLVGILAVGLLLAYANFPRASDQRGMVDPAPVPERRIGATVPTSEPRHSWQRVARPAPAQPMERAADGNAEDRPLATAPQVVTSALERSPPPPWVFAPAGAPAYAPMQIPSAGGQPAASVAVLPQRGATPQGATSPAALTKAAERFVAVVFTHQDKGTAQRAFVELRQQYPKLLQHRQSELQPVDVGKNGIWYRLVVLPPASRQQATETCARLAGAGYDRCWVKDY